MRLVMSSTSLVLIKQVKRVSRMTFRDLCSAREPGIWSDGFAKDYDIEEEPEEE